MPLALVLTIVLIPALWVSGVKKADSDWYLADPYSYSSCRSHCYYGFFEHLKPWPFREHATYESAKVGDVDKCTGEKFNGQWWYKP